MTVWEKAGIIALKCAARRRISEGVRIDTLPLRDRLLIYAAHPRKAARYFHWRFRCWTTLPGDTWRDFMADTYFVVTAVKPHHIEAEVYSGQIWHRPDLMAQAATATRVRIGSLFERQFGHGMVVEVAPVERSSMASWLPVQR
jgi:hypothetical protein